MKYIFLLLALCVGSFANEMCTELCATCENQESDKCSKVEEVCSCIAMRENFDNNSKKLQSEILKCDGALCKYKVSIVNDSIVEIVKLKQKPKSEPKDSVVAKENKEEMNAECKNMCEACNGSTEGETCLKVETLCKCSYFAELEQQLQEKRYNDSISAVESKFAKVEKAGLVFGQLKTACDTLQKCTVLFTVDEQMEAQNINVSDYVEKVFEPVVTAENTYENTYTTNENALQDTILRKKQEELPSFYIGLYLGYAQYEPDGYYEYIVNKIHEVQLGILFRKYFCKYWAFQFGLNTVFNWSENEYLNSYLKYVDSELYFLSLMGEVPLSLRFKIPIVREKFGILLSLNTDIRKPIYQWVVLTHSFKGRFGSNDENGENNMNGAAEKSDFEFLFSWGAGIELSRVFSIEYRYLLGALKTYPEASSVFDNGFRIVMNLAW